MIRKILTILFLFILQSCNCNFHTKWWLKNKCKEGEVKTKTIEFKNTAPESFLYPEFINNLRRKSSVSFIIRKQSLLKNELTSTQDVKSLELYWALEKSLVYNTHIVIDPTVYDKWQKGNKDRNPPFDYIIEIMEARNVSYPTNIHNRQYYGSLLSIRIINPVTAQIVGILNHSSTPCTSGCEITYNDCTIKDEKVLKTKTNRPTNYLSKGFSMNDVNDLISKLRELDK
jgi:hypothetical protein